MNQVEKSQILDEALSPLGWHRTPLGWHHDATGATMRQISASVLRIETSDGRIHKSVASLKRNWEPVVIDLASKVAAITEELVANHVEACLKLMEDVAHERE